MFFFLLQSLSWPVTVFLFLMLAPWHGDARRGTRGPTLWLVHECTWSTSYWTEASCRARGEEVELGVSSSFRPIAPIYRGWATPRVLQPLPWDILGSQGWATSSHPVSHPSNIAWCCQSGVPEMLSGTHAPHMPSPCSGPHWVGSGSHCWMQMVRGKLVVPGVPEGRGAGSWELLLARWGGSRSVCEPRLQAFGASSIDSLDATYKIQILRENEEYKMEPTKH